MSERDKVEESFCIEERDPFSPFPLPDPPLRTLRGSLVVGYKIVGIPYYVTRRFGGIIDFPSEGDSEEARQRLLACAREKWQEVQSTKRLVLPLFDFQVDPSLGKEGAINEPRSPRQVGELHLEIETVFLFPPGKFRFLGDQGKWRRLRDISSL